MRRIFGAVYGMSGSGKTYLIQNYIIPQLAKKKPVIVLDLMDEFKGTAYQGFDDFNEKVIQNRKAVEPGVHVIKWKSDPDAIQTIHFVLEQGNCSFVIDEAHVLFTDTDLAREVKVPLKKVTMAGRHFGVDSILCSQRPSDVASYVRSQAEFSTFFQLKDRTDLDFVRSKDPDLVDPIANLKKQFFLTVGDVPELLNKLITNEATRL